MSIKAETQSNNAQTHDGILVAIAAVLLGGAIGAKLADRIAGGSGLSTVLSQIGGSILGGIGGKAVIDAIRSETEREG